MSMADLALGQLNELSADEWAEWIDEVLTGGRPSGFSYPPDYEPHRIFAFVYDSLGSSTVRRTVTRALEGVFESTFPDQVNSAKIYHTLQAVAYVRPSRSKRRVYRLLMDGSLVGIVYETIDLDAFLLAVAGEYDPSKDFSDWLLERRERARTTDERDLITLRILARSRGNAWLQYLETLLLTEECGTLLPKVCMQLKAVLHRHGSLPFANWTTRMCALWANNAGVPNLPEFGVQFTTTVMRRSESLGPPPKGLLIAAAQLRAIREPLRPEELLQVAAISGPRYKRLTRRALENVWCFRLADLRSDGVVQRPWLVNKLHDSVPHVLTELDGAPVESEQIQAAGRLLHLERTFRDRYGPVSSDVAFNLFGGY